MLDLKEICVLIVVMFSVSFIACNKAPIDVGTLEIKESWKSDSEYNLLYRDAALYNDSYLVWGFDNDDNRLLLVYDLTTQNIDWIFDFSNISGWGTKLTIVDKYLVLKENNIGITVLDLDLKQTITAIRFAQDFPGMDFSDTPTTFNGNQIFITVTDPTIFQSRILAINLPSGNITEEFVFESDDFMIPRITNPYFYTNSDNETHSIVTIQLMRTNQSVARTSATLLATLDEQFNTNWQDTIDFENGTHPIEWLPIVYKDFMAVTFIDDLLVYQASTGLKLIDFELPRSSGSKLTLNEDGGMFFAQGLKRSMQKLDITNGTPMWSLNSTPAPSEYGDFLVQSDYIVYVRESFGNLTVIESDTGGQYEVLNQFRDGIANPIYLEDQGIYISHQEDKVLSFTLEEQ